jgi:hypothetical protein
LPFPKQQQGPLRGSVLRQHGTAMGKNRHDVGMRSAPKHTRKEEICDEIPTLARASHYTVATEKPDEFGVQHLDVSRALR